MGELIKDKSFDLNKTSEYKLSIQVSLDGFSFFILSVPEKKLVACKHDKLKISSESFIARRFSEWLDSEDLTSKKFHHTEAFYITPRFTLVPENFYDETKKQQLFHLILPPAPNEQIETENLVSFENRLLFAVQRRWKKEVKEKLDAEIKHPVSILTEKTINSNATESNSLALFFTGKTFFAVLVKNGKLMLSNSFHFSHVNDVIYYTLSLLNQYETAPKQTRLFAAGEIVHGDELSEQLKKHFPLFDYFSPKDALNIDSELFDIHPHQYIALFNQ